MAHIQTFAEAYQFVLREKICTIFGSQKSPYPSLWDHVDLPERRAGEKGWGEKVSAIWKWKNELPATYPAEIFYGKVVGGDAVLVEMRYLKTELYPSAYQDVATLPLLAQQIYQKIRIEPRYTGGLRKILMEETGCTKSRFDTALKKLQISLNITRSNDPTETRDLWLPFSELYPEIASE